MDAFTNVVIGFAIGAVAGATSAFLGWNKSGEPFDVRKFISGLATGIVAGLAFVLASVASIQQAADQTALVIAYVALFLGIIGVDTVRTSITGAIRNKTESKPAEPTA